MIKGDSVKLGSLQSEDTWIDLTIEANHCLDGFGVVRAWVGDGITDIMTRRSNLISA